MKKYIASDSHKHHTWAEREELSSGGTAAAMRPHVRTGARQPAAIATMRSGTSPTPQRVRRVSGPGPGSKSTAPP